MAISKPILMALLVFPAAAWSREAASPSSCQAAAKSSAIVAAKGAAQKDPNSLSTQFHLADAWSDAGCFSEAVQVLQAAETARPDNQELETRLRVARSLVKEEHYFDDLDRADTEAKFKRDLFRCSTLGDLEACGEAVRLKPDDSTALTAQGDALVKANHPAEAVGAYRRALASPSSDSDLATKINSAETLASSERAKSERPNAPAAPVPLEQPIHVATNVKPRSSARPALAARLAPVAKQYSNVAPAAESH